MVNTRKALGALVIFLACFSFHVRNPRGIGSENVSRQAQIRAQSWKRKHFEHFASGLFHGEISVVMLAFVFASLEKTRLNLLNKKE